MLAFVSLCMVPPLFSSSPHTNVGSGAEKQRSCTIAETLRGGNTGCGGEEQRSGIKRSRAQARTGDPMAPKNSPMVSHKNANLELGKSGLRVTKRTKKYYLTYMKVNIY